jgi:hypothetical protein
VAGPPLPVFPHLDHVPAQIGCGPLTRARDSYESVPRRREILLLNFSRVLNLFGSRGEREQAFTLRRRLLAIYSATTLIEPPYNVPWSCCSGSLDTGVSLEGVEVCRFLP